MAISDEGVESAGGRAVITPGSLVRYLGKSDNPDYRPAQPGAFGVVVDVKEWRYKNKGGEPVLGLRVLYGGTVYRAKARDFEVLASAESFEPPARIDPDVQLGDESEVPLDKLFDTPQS
jgi:hypothetical protein